MKISVNCGSFFDMLSPEKACAEIAAAGFSSIDWEFDPMAGIENEESVIQALSKNDLHVERMTATAPLYVHEDEAASARCLENARRALRLCGRLACGTLVVPPIAGQKEHGFSHAALREKNLALYEALISEAGANGVTVCVENTLVDWRGYPYAGYCTYPEEAVDLVDALNEIAREMRFAASLDTGRLDLARSDFFAYAYKLGKRLVAVRMNDNYGSYDDRTIPMTGGVIAWDYVCRALKQNGYCGGVEISVSFDRYAREMLPSALALAADSARVIAKRIGEEM